MYELIVVAKVEGATGLFEKVEKFLKEASVQDLKIEKMGKKTLAYPIAKQQEAEYFLFNFDVNPSEILQLDRKIRLEQEAVLRHLLIKSKPVRAKKPSRVAKATEAAKVEEPKIEVKPKVTVTTKITTKPKTETKKAEPKAKAKGKK